MNVGKKKQGFTIVELLIVIVVIAILAAITIVAYNGVMNRSHDSSVQTDMKNIGTLAAKVYAETGFYPVSVVNNVAPAGMESTKATKGSYDTSANNFYYCVSTDNEKFSVIGRSKSGKTWVYYSGGGVREYTASWTSSSTICPPTLSVPNNTSFYSFSYGYNGSGGWLGWVN